MNNRQQHYAFNVNKKALQQTQFIQQPGLSAADLQPGQILVESGEFAFTANNISYAVTGDKFDYWSYFPTGDGAWGNIPVWGYAQVVASKHEAILTGEWLYGYFPMQSQLVMQPENTSDISFLDQYEHRKQLHETYNTYSRLDTKTDTADIKGKLRPSLQPLFWTSFLVDDFIAYHDFFGATQLILVSASSKTSIALAYMLAKRPDIQCIGLTSETNLTFTKGLGLYDEVLTYDELGSLNPDIPTVVVDFSGNGPVLEKLHHLYQDNLKHDCLIGKSHWREETVARDTIPGARPKMFWAPAHVAVRRKEWGEDVYIETLDKNWRDYAHYAGKHYKLTAYKGPDAIKQVYLNTLEGKVNPAEILLLSL